METTTIPLKPTKRDVYTIVTEKIIELLEKGTVPWRRPWKDGGLPRNLISGRQYRGINLLLLSFLGYEHNLFLTYNQLQKLGGKVKKGEHSHMITYWNFIDQNVDQGETSDEHYSTKKKAILKYYYVLNIAQCEGIPRHMIELETEVQQLTEIPDCAKILALMPNRPEIRHEEQRAYYNPLYDFVNLPKFDSFESAESYYATAFHELIHATGHQSRLNRKDLLKMAEFGSEPYSHEELVAEIGSCYLLSMAGIDTEIEKSAAYIRGWLDRLKNDVRLIVSAASQAQKAAEYVLGMHSQIPRDIVEE